MKSQKYSIILILFILLLVTSCATAPKRTEADIFTGFEGLSIEFGQNAPPPRVFERSPFPVLLKITNNGAQSIKENKGILTIGREKDYIPTVKFERDTRITIPSTSDKNIDNQRNFNIDGKTLFNPKGDELVVYFDATTGRLEAQSEQKTSVMTANICYPYQTSLSTTICIDPDAVGIRQGQKACQVHDLAFANGQGAPISITMIQEQIIPVIDENTVKPQFLIFIENKGNGNPVNINSYGSVCTNTGAPSPDQRSNIWNVAYVNAFASGNEQLVCCPDKEGKCNEDSSNSNDWQAFVRFKDNKDFVRCIFRNGIPKSNAAFTSPLRVEISYGYAQTVSVSFTIQKPLRY